MQAIRVVLTASFLGLFGFAGFFANYGAPPSTSSDLKKTANQLNMPNSVSTLLTRNLRDVFGENDPARRRRPRVTVIAYGIVSPIPARDTHTLAVQS
jgi:hypothetical protein